LIYTLQKDGFAVIDFPAADFAVLAKAAVEKLDDCYDWDGWQRRTTRDLFVQDAWPYIPEVREIAANPSVLQVLSGFYGRRAFPFQTLNVALGFQMELHRDALEFASTPEGMTAAVMVALEDVDAENGPPIFCPAKRDPVHVHLKKGQAVIWLSHLLYKDSPRTNSKRTRYTQTTHYYFEGCSYYDGRYSNAADGTICYRDVIDLSTKQSVPQSVSIKEVERARESLPPDARLPRGFDRQSYLSANPDVAQAGVDPVQHWLSFGYREGRRIRP
jgi:hypothetical protein